MSYEDLAHAHQRLLRVKRLFVHLAATIVLAVGLTILIEQRGAPRSLEAIIPAAILVFIAHALWLMYQEVQRFILHQEEVKEKPKRSERLADDTDGELVEMMFEGEPQDKRKRGA